MAEFLLVETSGLAAPDSCRRFLADGITLSRQGVPVSVWFVENGVTAAVAGAMSEVDELGRLSAELWVDEFALRQRGLVGSSLAATVRTGGMDEVAVAVLGPDVRVVWH